MNEESSIVARKKAVETCPSPGSVRSLLVMNLTRHQFVPGAVSAAASACVLLSAQADDPNPTAWKTTAGLNASVSKGNSDTVLIGGTINAIKKWDKNELALGADATYGNNKDQTTEKTTTTAQTYGAFGQYNRLLTDLWYIGAHVEGRQDRIANVMYRITLSPNTGYYFIKNDKISLSGDVGPGLVFEELRNSATGRDVSSSYITLRFSEKFSWKINDRARLIQDAEYDPRPDNFDNYVANGSIGLDTKITEKLSARITFQDFYRSEPAPGRKKNDLRLLAGLTYTF
jgi:putative salt-induced outer membrane protein YdiY